MTWRGTLFGVLVAALAFAGQVTHAQTAPATSIPENSLHVYVLTFGPGDDPWEKFGHNAIRIVDENRDDELRDVTFNWGVFSFDKGAIAFARNFLQGRLMYSMGADTKPEPPYSAVRSQDADKSTPMLDWYSKTQDRTIQQQELNLTLDQKSQLRHQLLAMYRNPATRDYLYDYYKNNCATRVRDIVNDLSKGRLAENTKGVDSGTTLRWHTARLTAAEPWLYVLLQGALAQPVDRPIDRWQEMFLPTRLHDRLNELTVRIDGYEKPFVLRDETIYTSKHLFEPLKPPMMSPWLAAVGTCFGALLVLLARSARRHWAARWGFILLSLPWLLLMSVGGSILWWFWLETDHAVTRPNENVLQVSVLAFPLLIMLPRLALGKRWGAASTQRLTLFMLVLACLGVLAKALPWFYQGNWPIIALCLPVNAALAYAAWLMVRSLPTPGLKSEHPSTTGKRQAIKPADEL